jgi:hypothetical protein
MKNSTLKAIVLLTTLFTLGWGQSAADSVAIKKTALNYIDGYYEANTDRMTMALHPELAKRMVYHKENTDNLHKMTADDLITGTGKKEVTPEEKRKSEVTILDIYGNTASVKIVAADWIDYLHIVKWDGEWKIINVLWELIPRNEE